MMFGCLGPIFLIDLNPLLSLLLHEGKNQQQNLTLSGNRV